MYKITIIETAEELIRCALPDVPDGTNPSVTNGELVFENNMETVHLSKVGEYVQLSEKITVEDIIKALAKNANLSVRIT